MADGDRQLLGERRSFGPFALLPAERLLTRDGVPVEIGGRSFDLLVVLTEQPGQILSKRDLLKRVWPDVVVEDGSLRFHMAGLRKLLGEGTGGARYIATQVGVGYAFVAPVAVQGPETGQTVTPAPAPLAPTHNIPPRLPHLIGRTEDLALLQDRVMDTPLFTIVGAGGVGKTSLAIEIGHALAPQFANRVAFVDFSMLENPGLVRPMIAGAMGLTVQSNDPLAVILGHLRDQSFLLLLDNCEHLIGPTAELVEHIIDAAPQVRILATSREPLRVRGEHVHRLDALGYPDDAQALTLAELRAYPAIELFLERARAADSQFRVDEGDARLIGDLCARLGGMALPIELAAVRAATHGLEATARQLGERFSLMWPGRRTALPRQQTLQATLDWSHDLLPDVERIVLERLAIFVGPFSIDAALAVVADALVGADDIAAAVDQLVAKSLIAPNRMRGAGTYRLLEMTRAHGRQHLLTRGQAEVNANARRHAAYYLAELEALLAQEDDVLQDQRPLRQQLGNIRSALDWAFGDKGDRRIDVRLAAASAPVFLNLSHLIECRNWCSRALAEMMDSERCTAIELELQGALAIALMFTRGNRPEAGKALDRALEIARLLDDHWSELRILGRLHIFHERIGEYQAAMDHAARAIQVAEAVGEDEAIGVAYSLSGISHHLAGNQIQARADLEMSLAHAPQSLRSQTVRYGFDHRNRSIIALARTLWLTGDERRAKALARQAVEDAATLNHPVTLCIALIWSLSIHSWMRDFAAAEETLATFADCAEANALGPYIAAASGFAGEFAILRGEAGGGALAAIEQCLVRLRTARYDLLTTPFSIALAQGMMLDTRFTEAGNVIDATIRRCEANGEQCLMPELLRIKARIAIALLNGTIATPLLDRAMTLARQQGAVAWELRAAGDLASS